MNPAASQRDSNAQNAGLSSSMRPLWLFWGGVVGLGLLVRLYYFATGGGIHHADQHMQYVEPAYWYTWGNAWLPWEYQRGVRSWGLPASYGALLEFADTMGWRGWATHRFLAFHNALLSLAVVPAAYRLGAAISTNPAANQTRSGLALALWCAVFPPMVAFSPHTLSEVHGLVVTTWAFAFWAELRGSQEKRGPARERNMALCLGVLIGVSVWLRFTLLAFFPVVFLDLLWRQRRVLGWTLLSFVGVILCMGALDALTWQYPFQSIIEYFRYNLIEDGASNHGVSPWYMYAETLFVRRLGWASLLLLLPFAWSFRRQRVWGTVALFALVAFSCIRHKEERFLLSMWPVFLACAWLGSDDLIQRARGLLPQRGLLGRIVGSPDLLLVIQLLCVCGAGFAGANEIRLHRQEGLFRAQDFVGQQVDASGLLVDDRLHLSGGYTLLAKNIPLLQYRMARTKYPVFNYVAVYRDKKVQEMDRHPDFERLRTFWDRQIEKDVVVYRRKKPGSEDMP